MTRLGTTGGDRIEVKPANNVYTVLAAVACVLAILGLLVVFTRAKELVPPGLL
ncbi:MAG: hypothetical protein JWO31_3602 [Phycisphaerales bacterium]|nr:hypothetical protein [Phycisphaerales bacterium]